jgi:hypothetical protein
VHRATLDGFSFHGQSAGCDFDLTLRTHGSSFRSFRVILAGSEVQQGVERRYLCGCTLLLEPAPLVMGSVEMVLERVEQLTPGPLDKECVELLTDALRDWFSASLVLRTGPVSRD